MTVDVSLIVTAYNVERYIERALHSALSQTGVTLEVIFVDDCSTDGTWALASAIADPRLTCLRLPQNGGPGAARNAGIVKASGAWIAVLDGDDALEPERTARCLARAQAARADVVVDNLTVRREADGAAFPMFDLRHFATLDLAGFIAGNQSFLQGHGLGYLKPVFSAAFLRKYNLSYDRDIRIGEDYLLLAETLASGAVCAVEQTAGYLYTVRAGSISHRLGPDDVARISAGDQKLLSRHTLDAAALAAQRQREFHLREALAYVLLIAALKKKNVAEAFRALRPAPTALRHLWMPLHARVTRLLRGRA